MSAKERGQEMETLPGAQKSGHNTCTVVDAGGCRVTAHRGTFR